MDQFGHPIDDGHRLGHFRVVGEAGQGGMGSVYIGLDETLGRKVALKVIRADQRLDPARKARFLREAKVLSSLDHPGICQFHDYIEGKDQDCLVLELVDGTSLHEAMATGMDDEARMVVARQLLDVLVAVHSQGVIHRDLKPENIMLCREGGIKVLDFGLARPVEDPDALSGQFWPVQQDGATGPGTGRLGEAGSDPSGDGSGPSMTVLGTVMGTLGYMSPEVARGEPATAASDLYSTGLILQELFTGKKPIPENLPPAERHRRAMWAEVEPPVGLAVELAELIRRLESLVPQNRPTAIDAAQMLGAIHNRPRVRRRRMLVAAVWTVLFLFGAGMTVQFLRAEKAMRRAESEAATAREVSSFLKGIFEHASPNVTQGSEITVQELLRRGADAIDEELHGQPVVRARMLHTLGSVQYQLGQFDEAAPLLEDAMEIRDRALEEGDEERVATLRALGLARRAQGRYEEAGELFSDAIRAAERARGGETIEMAHLLISRSGIDQDLGRWDEAERKLVRAVAVLEDQPDGVEGGLTDAVFDLAMVNRKLQRYEEAEILMLRCLELDEDAYGEHSLPVAGDLGELGAIAGSLGRFEDAEGFARRSLRIREQILGDDHPHVGHSATRVAWALRKDDRTDEATVYLLRALEIYRKAYGSDHAYVGDVVYSLGVIALDDGDLDAAGDLLSESLVITETSRGPEHPSVIETASDLAGVRRDQGRLEEADDLYRRALILGEKTYGSDSSRLTEVLIGYADCLRRMEREDEAADIEERAAVVEAAGSV